MKTMNTMKSIALAGMMIAAMTASAATNTNATTDKGHGHGTVANAGHGHGHGHGSGNGYTMNLHTATNHNMGMVVESGHGHNNKMMRECYCRDCKHTRKALDKHIRKHHSHRRQHGKQACRTCMEYTHMLNMHFEMVNNMHQHHNHR